MGFAYDGEGNRVWQSNTASGVTSTTVYVNGDVAEYTFSTGSSTGSTNRYTFAGMQLAVRGGNSWHYFLTDHLGTPEVRLSSTGSVEDELLTGPYGRWRYAATRMYGYAFTGQQRDGASDIMYFHARYYDPALGQFVSADTVLQGGGFSICGLNRYGYVKDNPESLVDPSGNCPQKTPSRLAKAARIARFLIVLALNMMGQGPTPSAAVANENNPSTPVEIVQQTEDKDPRSADNTTGPGDGCDDNNRINTEEDTPAIEVECAGRTIATVSRSGETVRWNRVARRHPQWVKREQMSNAQALQVTHAWTAHLEAVSSAAFGPVGVNSPFVQRLIQLNGASLQDLGLRGWTLQGSASPSQSSQPSNQSPGQQIPYLPSDIVPSGAPSGVPEGVPDFPWEIEFGI
jgi:RHS repeat-associated protein